MKRVARKEVKAALKKNLELKTWDGIVAISPSTLVPWIQPLTTTATGPPITIQQGIGRSSYIGDTITPKSLDFRYTMTNADVSNMVRIIIVQNLAGGVPILGTLLQFTGTVSAIISPYQHSYRETYRVLYDRVIVLNPTDKLQAVVKKRIPIRNPIHFTDAVGTLASGGLYGIAISDSSVSPDPAGLLVWRLTYTDA